MTRKSRVKRFVWKSVYVVCEWATENCYLDKIYALFPKWRIRNWFKKKIKLKWKTGKKKAKKNIIQDVEWMVFNKLWKKTFESQSLDAGLRVFVILDADNYSKSLIKTINREGEKSKYNITVIWTYMCIELRLLRHYKPWNKPETTFNELKKELDDYFNYTKCLKNMTLNEELVKKAIKNSKSWWEGCYSNMEMLISLFL